MYMATDFIDLLDTHFAMAGVFLATIVMHERLSRLGYQEVGLTDNCLLGKAGDKVFGNELHYLIIQEIYPSIATVYQLQAVKGGMLLRILLGVTYIFILAN
jgi:cobyrinic acid a,c-diamide synthase